MKKYRITRLRGSDECSERAASIIRKTDVQVGLAYSTSIHEWKRRFERTPGWVTAPDLAVIKRKEKERGSEDQARVGYSGILCIPR